MGSNYEIEEFRLSSDPLHLLNVHGAACRSWSWTAQWRPGAGDPGQERSDRQSRRRDQLAPGQLLIVLGSRPQLKSFQDLLGEAVDSIETMAG